MAVHQVFLSREKSEVGSRDDSGGGVEVSGHRCVRSRIRHVFNRGPPAPTSGVGQAVIDGARPGMTQGTHRDIHHWLGESPDILQAVGFFRVENCRTQAVLPLVGLAADKVIPDRCIKPIHTLFLITYAGTVGVVLGGCPPRRRYPLYAMGRPSCELTDGIKPG
ncbi:MAG: hypothetical protein ACQESR_01290 [Planctomycetota bacterium]